MFRVVIEEVHPAKAPHECGEVIKRYEPEETPTLDRLNTAYRSARSEAHPDRATGSAQRFDEIQKAYEQACQEIE